MLELNMAIFSTFCGTTDVTKIVSQKELKNNGSDWFEIVFWYLVPKHDMVVDGLRCR
jgi:hypothetical protein